MSLAEYDCYELQRILKGSKGDEAILLEIFLTRTSKHLKTVKETYQRCKQLSLLDDSHLCLSLSLHFSVSENTRTGYY